jgi:AcrR family transcriptional regulator
MRTMTSAVDLAGTRAVSPVEATRRRLLDAARLGLARFGSRKLSMTDVAEFAGVSRRTLYRYFPSMEDLLEALGEDELRSFDAGIAAAVRDHPPGDRLDAVVKFMSDSLSDDHLQQLVITEPAFVLKRFVTILPALRTSLAALIEHERTAEPVSRSLADDLADALIRLAMSHFLLPEGDPTRFDRSAAAIIAAALELSAGTSPRTAGGTRR